MDESSYRLLEQVVARYDEVDGPVSPERLATAVDGDAESINERLARLERCELVATVDGGVRPTVTARELLALDIDDPSVLVIDTGEDC
jgi:predicted transcriptional regulator